MKPIIKAEYEYLLKEIEKGTERINLTGEWVSISTALELCKDYEQQEIYNGTNE